MDRFEQTANPIKGLKNAQCRTAISSYIKKRPNYFSLSWRIDDYCTISYTETQQPQNIILQEDQMETFDLLLQATYSSVPSGPTHTFCCPRFWLYEYNISHMYRQLGPYSLHRLACVGVCGAVCWWRLGECGGGCSHRSIHISSHGGVISCASGLLQTGPAC